MARRTVAPASVVISADAADSNGTVTRVEFFQGTTSLGFRERSRPTRSRGPALRQVVTS
jgi:hypothetical protein